MYSGVCDVVKEKVSPIDRDETTLSHSVLVVTVQWLLSFGGLISAVFLDVGKNPPPPPVRAPLIRSASDRRNLPRLHCLLSNFCRGNETRVLVGESKLLFSGGVGESCLPSLIPGPGNLLSVGAVCFHAICNMSPSFVTFGWGLGLGKDDEGQSEIRSSWLPPSSIPSYAAAPRLTPKTFFFALFLHDPQMKHTRILICVDPVVPLAFEQVALEASTVPPEGASENELESHRLAKLVDGLIDRKVRRPTLKGCAVLCGAVRCGGCGCATLLSGLEVLVSTLSLVLLVFFLTFFQDDPTVLVVGCFRLMSRVFDKVTS